MHVMISIVTGICIQEHRHSHLDTGICTCTSHGAVSVIQEPPHLCFLVQVVPHCALFPLLLGTKCLEDRQVAQIHEDSYMEIHVLSTLAYENKKEKKGNPPNRDLDKETYIARDTWMPSLENWGSTHTCTACVYMYADLLEV